MVFGKRNCSLNKAIPAIIRTNFQRGLPLNYCEYFNKKNIGIDDDMSEYWSLNE